MSYCQHPEAALLERIHAFLGNNSAVCIICSTVCFWYLCCNIRVFPYLHKVDWANMASVCWRIFNFTFICASIDILDLNNLAKISRALLFKDPESLCLTSNVKLTQSGRHHSTPQEVPGSIPTGGNLFSWFFVCSSLRKDLLTLPTLCNTEKLDYVRTRDTASFIVPTTNYMSPTANMELISSLYDDECW